MELTRFVKEAVVQAACGLRQANDELRALGMQVKRDDTVMVTLDVGVVLGHGENLQATLVVREADGLTTKAQPLVHRITFTVPFTLTTESSTQRNKRDQNAEANAVLEERLERFTSPFS